MTTVLEQLVAAVDATERRRAAGHAMTYAAVQELLRYAPELVRLAQALEIWLGDSSLEVWLGSSSIEQANLWQRVRDAFAPFQAQVHVGATAPVVLTEAERQQALQAGEPIA